MEFFLEFTHVELQFIDLAGKAVALGDSLALEFCSTAADTVCGAWESLSTPPLEFVPLITAVQPLPSIPAHSLSSLDIVFPTTAASPLHPPAEDSAAGSLPGSIPLSDADSSLDFSPPTRAASPQQPPAEDSAAACPPASILQSGADLITSEAPALFSSEAPSLWTPDDVASTSDESEITLSPPPAIITSSFRTAEETATTSSEDYDCTSASDGSEITSASSTASSSPRSSPPASPRAVQIPTCDTLQEYLQKKRKEAKMKRSSKNQKNVAKREKRAAKRAQGA